ncbi:MAG: MFS transporter [Burkholderiaceae bacterium]|nr:MFS transporter [Burkholderiaceae bacterium]
MKRIDPALVVILAGVSAALHVAKLPPALPVLRDAMGITLVQSGFLLSMVQLAGMCLGLGVGLMADGIGLKRSMLTGLLLLSAAGAAGGWAESVESLLVLRALEGFGFLLATTPAPSLVRQLVPQQRINAMLGLWGAYMPFATSMALLGGPLLLAAIGWPGWWWLLALISFLMAVWLWWAVPPMRGWTPGAPAVAVVANVDDWRRRLVQTLSARGPWLASLSFAVYSSQWLSVMGFLPSIYTQAGVSGVAVGLLTALAAGVNIIGNVVAGRLVQRGVRPERLLRVGFVAMALGAFVAFAGGDAGLAGWRYLGVLGFSMVGGMIPGTLFTLAVRLAPNERTVSTTVGWMQQWSSIGQFAGPPLVGWVASRVGGWHWTWAVTGGFAVLGLLLASHLGRLERLRR